MTTETETAAVDSAFDIHDAILSVYEKIGYVPKRGRIDSGSIRYNFAGEADFIAALRPAMIDAGIYQSPESMVIISNDRLETRRIGANGQEFVSYQFRVVVQVAYRFAHAASGTSILVPAFGEGMDSGDKAFNKAMTGANKYALRQTFMIETGDDPDKYASHPEGGIDTPDAMKNNNAKPKSDTKPKADPKTKPSEEPKTEAEQPTDEAKQAKLSVKVINEVANAIPQMNLEQLADVEKKIMNHGVASRIDRTVWGDLSYGVFSRMIELSPADASVLAAIANKVPPLAGIGVMSVEQRANLTGKINDKIGAAK